jgi:hypothetical protein
VIGNIQDGFKNGKLRLGNIIFFVCDPIAITLRLSIPVIMASGLYNPDIYLPNYFGFAPAFGKGFGRIFSEVAPTNQGCISRKSITA